MCPRCLFGDVLAVLDGPIPPKPPTTPLMADRRRIGEYELLEELGRGGMGVVWKARQTRLNRIVALKLVRGGCLPGEAAAKRFRREAEAAAQLKHPHIVVIHEVGESDEQLYLCMELVEGGSLADWLKRVAFSPRDAATLLAKVARGVHHAHENQILHRDLKPANILLSPMGEPQVCDFGLARLGDSESSLTLSGELLGTPAYLSPEQASGKMRDLTPASDTYSLGAILYELLCGHPPFSADNIPALLRKVAEDDPMRPISHYSGSRVPSDLSTICLKCLEKEPAARYSSALALSDDLERWLRGEPILARPVPRVERLWKWVRRKPVLAALWLGITVLMIVVAVVATVMSVSLEQERKRVAALADVTRHQVARQLSESAQRYMSGGDYLRALPGLAEAIRVGTGDPRLDEADRIRFAVLLRASPTLKKAWLGNLPITRAEATIDGERLFLSTERSAEVWAVTAGQRIGDPIEFEKSVSNAQFDSATGRWVLVEAEGRIEKWEPDSGKRADFGEGHLYTPPDAYMQRSANFVSYRKNEAEVRSVADGKRVAGPFTHAADVQWAVILPGMDRALSADMDEAIYLWDLTTGMPAGDPIKLGKTKKSLSLDTFDPVSKRAALHRERDCWVLDCRTGTLVSEILDAKDSPQSLGYDEHGNWLFLARNNEGVTLRSLMDGTIVWSWLHNGLGFRGNFTPGSGAVATQSWNGSTRVFRISNGRPMTPFLWQTATPGSCILDPKLRWLLMRGDEPAARMWQLKDEEGAIDFPIAIETPVNAWHALDPNRLCVAEADGMVRAWEKELPRRRAGEVQHPEPTLLKAGPCADGTRFFTVGGRSAQAWDSRTFKAVGAPVKLEKPIIDAAIDATGTQFALLDGDGRISVHDSARGRIVTSMAAAARQVEFSADGKRILAVGEKIARVWNAATGEAIATAGEEKDEMVRARFSPDGRRVLQWTARKSTGPYRAIVWDAETGAVKTTLPPHWQGIGDAMWSPDGKLVVTGGHDHMLLLSDAETGSLVIPPIQHGQKVATVGFSKDGLLMWSLADKEIVVWSTVSGEVISPRLRQSKTPIAITMATGNGRELAVVCPKAFPTMWSLSADLRPPAELANIAHALSAHAVVGGTSALRPLTMAEMRAAWESVRQAIGAW